MLIAVGGFLSCVYSQDVIVLKNGDELKAIVSEVDLQVVKYKKFENPTGPVYTVEKSQVFMIKYENGSKDVFTEPVQVQPQPQTQPQIQKPEPVASPAVQPKPQTPAPKMDVPPLLTSSRGEVYEDQHTLEPYKVRDMFARNPEALSLYNSGKMTKGWGEFFDWTSYGFILLWYLQYKAGAPNYYMVLSGFIGFSITGMILKGVGNSKIKKAVLAHNSKIINSTSIDLNLNIHADGVGLAIRF